MVQYIPINQIYNVKMALIKIQGTPKLYSVSARIDNTSKNEGTFPYTIFQNFLLR